MTQCMGNPSVVETRGSEHIRPKIDTRMATRVRILPVHGDGHDLNKILVLVECFAGRILNLTPNTQAYDR